MIEISNFRVALTNIPAETEALTSTWYVPGTATLSRQHIHLCQPICAAVSWEPSYDERLWVLIPSGTVRWTFALTNTLHNKLFLYSQRIAIARYTCAMIPECSCYFVWFESLTQFKQWPNNWSEASTWALSAAVHLFKPKYRLGHPENYLLLLSKNIFTGSKYPKNK